jgi:uncharacterized protein
MGEPVVLFEVVGRDPARLRAFFSQCVDWSFEGCLHRWHKKCLRRTTTGFLDLITTDDATGIRGGVGGGPGFESHAGFYIGCAGCRSRAGTC